MIDIKADFSGGLNLDDAIYNVPKNSYIDAENITTDAIAGANDKAITNIVGNQLVNYTLPAGINVCIGAYPNNVRNTVIYFVWNSNDNHLILEYDNNFGTISPIFENLVDSAGIDILNFDRNKKITSINVYNRNPSFDEGDLLFFIDSLGRPTGIDIERFRIKEYNPVTRDIIDVCKRPPLFPPDVLYGNDATKTTNNLRNRLFRFKYRYVYDANERSVCSPISTLPLPINILDETHNSVPTNNNKIEIQLTTGDKDVKSIELLMSYVRGTNDWSDFALVETIDKESLLLSSTYIVQSNPAPLYTDTIISFSGIVTENTLIEVIFRDIPARQNVVIASYTTIAGDTLNDIVNGLASSSSIPAVNTNGNLVITAFVFDYTYNSVSITGATTDFGIFIYSFYNDGTYPVIDVQESIQLFDYVPDLANAQEMANGNVLIYGGITEGYNRTLTPNVVNTILTTLGGSPPGGLGYKISFNRGEPWITQIDFFGIPIPNTTIEIFGITPSSNIVLYSTYTTAQDDDINKIAFKLAESFNNLYVPPIISSGAYTTNIPGRIVINWGFPSQRYAIFNNVSITPPPFTSADNSIPTFLFSTTRKLGIAYFDKKGKTNGILYSDKLVFPDYAEQVASPYLVEVPYINTKIYHTPPDWAHSYGFYLTKEATQFLYWYSIKVETDNEFVYFNISNLAENQKIYPTTTQVLSYTFQDGDRLRLIRNATTNATMVTNDFDAAIIGVVKNPVVSPSIPNGDYVKIKKQPPFDTYNFSTDEFVIQLYRPTQQLPTGANEVYYEFGEQYGIGNPGTPTAYHLGMITNQGVIPTNAITCQVSVVTNPIIQNEDISTLAFSGIPFSGVQIDINITQLPGTPIQLATYVIQQGDTISDVISNLIPQLTTQLGTYLTNVTTLGNDIYLSYLNASFSLTQSDVVITYPAPNTIPAEFNFYGGDVYIRPRTVSTNDGLGSSGFATYNVLDRNFLDDYISAVNSVDGRPSVIDINARKAYYSTLVRFGQAYQPNTNINGLNRFFPANFDEYDYSYGDIMRLKVRDRFIRVFQKLKVGKVPLYSQIVKDPSNVQNLIVSDKLINPIAYYVGDLGIGEHAESLASYNYADYFTSNIKGIIARVGEEGVSFLSIDHKVDSWAAMKLPLRTGNFKVYGGLDQILGNYIITLESIPNVDEAYTLVYDVNSKIFSTFFSYHPEMMVTLATVFISFKDGQLYTHDNPNYNTFFGQPAADSSVTLAFNQSPLDKKTFMSVGEVASQIWDVPQIQTDINSFGSTKMESNLVDADFVELEGTFEAPILRDINSIGGILEGDSMKGKYMTMKFRAKAPTSLVSLNLLSLKSINSPLNNR